MKWKGSVFHCDTSQSDIEKRSRETMWKNRVITRIRYESHGQEHPHPSSRALVGWMRIPSHLPLPRSITLLVTLKLQFSQSKLSGWQQVQREKEMIVGWVVLQNQQLCDYSRFSVTTARGRPTPCGSSTWLISAEWRPHKRLQIDHNEITSLKVGSSLLELNVLLFRKDLPRNALI